MTIGTIVASADKRYVQDELEFLVPSSTISIGGKGTTASSQTQLHARTLRGLLESLDEMKYDRSQLVAKAQRLADLDNIKAAIIAGTSNIERCAELTPAMFADVSDGELAKYDGFIQGLAEGKKKQEGLLESIKVGFDYVDYDKYSDEPAQSTNEQFLLSRKEDPTVKEREIVLHNLDMAHAKYREITRNLDEGLKVKHSRHSSLHTHNICSWLVVLQRDDKHPYPVQGHMQIMV